MGLRISALGFPSELDRASAHLVFQLANDARRSIETAAGSYRVWRDVNGAELYFHYEPRSVVQDLAAADPAHGAGATRALRQDEIDASGVAQLRAVTPFHATRGELTLRVVAAHRFDPGSALQGCYIANLMRDGRATTGPSLVIEMVPFAMHPPVRSSAAMRLRVACFAERVWMFDGMRRYLEETPAQRRQALGALMAVAPHDVPEVSLEYRSSVVSLGLVTGRVLRAVTQVNPVTEQPYVWLLLKTRAGVLDVFADPCAIRGGVEAGAIAQVCGSFTGQLVDLGAQSAGALSLPQLQQAKVVAFPARR